MAKQKKDKDIVIADLLDEMFSEFDGFTDQAMEKAKKFDDGVQKAGRECRKLLQEAKKAANAKIKAIRDEVTTITKARKEDKASGKKPAAKKSSGKKAGGKKKPAPTLKRRGRKLGK